ncbi:MAG TPA: glycerophosphodiester phosphodiesterase family protein [Flavisolibacter sp.]|jgi:glycerophosphoryl diester phosphodiesterase|nr:glycerophosphodiester phosphodiesterase family protein [Flavisolibacter sp.]
MVLLKIALRLVCALFLPSIFLSCQQLFDAPVPNLYWDQFEAASAQPLSPADCQKLEGVYQVLIADDDFGDSAVVKWTYDINGADTSHYLSVFCQEAVRYFILQGKSSGDSVLLNGYWRNVENTKTGKARFVISNRRTVFGSHDSTTSPAPMLVRGHYGMFEADPEKEINFHYARHLTSDSSFLVIAHRGGGRNNDLLPASENSLEMIHLASRLGANGVEIDVQLTKDSVPVLYHDTRLNDRLTKGPGIRGELSLYTYEELTKDVTLKRGGRIPTLQDALHTVVYNTPLRFVWLDCKGESTLRRIQILQEGFLQKAKAAGRQVEIVIGIPDEEQYHHFLRLPRHSSIPSLCELDQEKAKRMGAEIWATTWIKGLQSEEVADAHRKGMRALTFTMDVPLAIREFMQDGQFDGIVTNRPSAVAFHHYTRP